MSQRHFFVALLCLAWIVPGLIGHDPWKSDEAYTFGVVYDLLRGGSLLNPMLAGEPFLDEPPLYYLTAAATAWLTSAVLPLHDGARLATGLYMGLTFLFCGLASRELNGRGHGALAALLLLGTFGLVVRSHQTITDVAPLAGFALAYYALALAQSQQGNRMGGLLFGTAVGVAFLSQGILETAILVLMAAILPLASTAWRTPGYVRTLGIAALIAVPAIAAWPLALHLHSPALLTGWVRHDLHTLLTGEGRDIFYFVRLMPWYAWPVWLVGCWSLWMAWRQRSQPSVAPLQTRIFMPPAVVLPLTGLIVSFVALSLAGSARDLNALPLLPALALLAVPGVARLRRGAANAWLWFSVMAATFFIVVGWFYWTALELGMPARLHAHLHRIQPGYTPGFKTLAFTVAACYTAAWFALLARLKHVAHRPVVAWAAGVTVIWAMLNTLFLPWIDTGKSYRSVFVSMQKSMPAQYRCMSSRNLGEPQRALLQYVSNIVTFRDEIAARRRTCDLLLIQGIAQEEMAPAGWRKIWEGTRPGDKLERYRLYRRVTG